MDDTCPAVNDRRWQKSDAGGPALSSVAAWAALRSGVIRPKHGMLLVSESLLECGKGLPLWYF
jgi:hypothetical protein